MAIKFKHSDVYSTYFITFTCIEWISLFEITKSYDIVYNWFNILKSKYNADVLSYVIMPNHLHLIVHFHNDTFDLNKLIGNGKRFMAYEVINKLETNQDFDLLFRLESLLSTREKEKCQKHKVFIESFDAKPIFSLDFMIQKIDYIHFNPVSGKWNLANDFVEYEHSSASFYETGIAKRFTPLHFMDI